MLSTQICFPCKKCGSINTYCKGIEYIPTHMAAAYGMNMEFACKNCGAEFNKTIFAQEPYDFAKSYNTLPDKESIKFKIEAE